MQCVEAKPLTALKWNERAKYTSLCMIVHNNFNIDTSVFAHIKAMNYIMLHVYSFMDLEMNSQKYLICYH